ncbi:MAG: cell division protein FtsZ [Flexilinea sp.]|nr:cell division protein FtsZ [Flexilinea sp.]
MEKYNNQDIVYNKPVMKVIGLGGGGCNAIDRMLTMGYGTDDVEFIAANTDLQALQRCQANTKILMGPQLTNGLGSGGRPEVGEKAAWESEDVLRKALSGADIVFLTAGMGGGTGSGSISVAAEIAREQGAITIAVVSTPFSFEAGKRITNARNRLSKLAEHCDTLITIPNDQLLKVSPSNITLREAFAYADDVLRQGITGITQLLSGTGEINVDFSHIRHMMANGGGSLLSIGYGKGEDKVSNALYQALNHPLLEHLPIENATGIIANFTGGEDLSFGEVMEGLGHLQQFTGNNAEIIPGQIVDPNMKDEVQIILIITGIASTPLKSETVDKTVAEIGTVSNTSRVYAEPVRYAVETEPEPEPEMEMAYAHAEPVMAHTEVSSSDRLIPSEPAEVSGYTPSDAANAMFDTIMQPFGLSGIESSSRKVGEKRNGMDSVDYDTPTFLRRRL